MPSEFIQRQIDRLLEQASDALARFDWDVVRNSALAVLRLDAGNEDAQALLDAAGGADSASTTTTTSATSPQADSVPVAPAPTSFANGRYEVRRFLGEGGKKKVYLAHDSLLDRDVAFALIKTEGLDEVGKERITREAQAMGRLGDHPNIVTVYDIGTEGGQPYLVLPLLPGGDIEGLIEKAPEHRLPIEQVLKLGIETCQGLEFAHAKGIVHRDLKPGNVWLDEAGRAKIGDFGLAVAVDRSRLTQAGMMVGTVNYMPPEQAMGGEVTARSDLYSLGAMLYEMVCGRPPFVGDESVAIIGQHLNTPPVAPSWHRPDCPPGLEALILRLLEKNPSRRSASATEAREALTTLTLTLSLPGRGDQTDSEPSPSAGRGHGEGDPLYRRVFVGRESELKQMQQAFDTALSGQGGLVMVVGEPGIGKTAVCEQLSTYVAMRGGRTLAGHCYEEGSLSLPYLAFVEAMRSYVLAREPDALRSELGTGAADVARIVSEVRDRAGVELRPAGDPEDDRWRLLQAVTTFLRNASTVQPLLILLEDLHWADRGTLDLLLHLARNLQGARLLIVSTYRDVEIDRTHPLSNVLGDLRRIGSFPSVRLRGLSIDEVQRMMSNIRGQEVPLSRAELIHRQTEGNPLFVQEVLRYLVEEGITVRQDGRYQLANPDQPEAGIPEGLRDVIGKRLSRLSPECNRLLAVAAVIGREFDLATLRTVANVTEEQLIDAIEEAVHIGVLEERSRPGAVLYRFAHAFFRQTLYEEMIAPRRLRLHQEVARALEAQYGTRRNEHAAELAEHFAHSTDRDDLVKAIAYGEMAAQRGMSVFAYSEAEQHLRRCVEIQEVLNPDDRPRLCDLLLKLGEALQPAGKPLEAGRHIAEKAWKLSWPYGDRQRAFSSIEIAVQSLFRSGSIAISDTAEYGQWLERLSEFGPQTNHEKLFANFAHAIRAQYRFDYTKVRPLLSEALDIAHNLGQPRYLFQAFWLLNTMALTPNDELWRVKLTEEAMNWPRDGVSTRSIAVNLGFGGVNLWSAGNPEKTKTLWAELADITSHTQEPGAVLVETFTRALEFGIYGRLEEAVTQIRSLQQHGEAVGAEAAARIYAGAAGFTTLLHLGRYEDAMRLNYQPDGVSGQIAAYSWTRPLESLLLAQTRRLDEARSILQSWLLTRGTDSHWWIPISTSLLQAAIILDEKDLVTRLMDEIAPIASAAFFLFDLTCPARHLGAGARLLGRPDEARARYMQALQICEQVSFRTEQALVRLELAELLMQDYPGEHEAAIEHLDFAIAEFREMKMQPSLERALRHRGLLKA